MKSINKSKQPLPELSFLLLLSVCLVVDIFVAHPWGAYAAMAILFITGVRIGYRS